MLTDKAKTDTVPTWKAEILRKEHTNAVLDKIRAEIEQAIREETVVDSMGGEYERIVSTIDPDDVLAIIDKYRKE